MINLIKKCALLFSYELYRPLCFLNDTKAIRATVLQDVFQFLFNFVFWCNLFQYKVTHLRSFIQFIVSNCVRTEWNEWINKQNNLWKCIKIKWFNSPNPKWRVASIMRLKSLFRHGLSHKSTSPHRTCGALRLWMGAFPLKSRLFLRLARANQRRRRRPWDVTSAAVVSGLECYRLTIGTTEHSVIGHSDPGIPSAGQRFSSRRWAAPSSAPLPPRLNRGGNFQAAPPSSFVLRIAALRAREE